MRIALTLALALSLGLAGCIQNMTDLKDRLGANDAEEEPVAPAATEDVPEAPEPVVNVTKPPVARITIFGSNGALVFKSSFQAEDPTELVFVPESTTLSLIASESEALEPGATLATFAWTLNDNAIEGGRQANAEVGEAGVYVLALNVTDSNGQSDTQTVKIGVAPTPIEVVTDLVSGPVAGAEGEGQSGEAVFTLALDGAGVPATIQSVVFVSTAPTTCDHIMEVVGPDGSSLGSKDSQSVGAAETISAGSIPEGDYTIVIGPFACVAPEGVPITVTVTYLPVIEGLGSGDGHGHAH